MLIGRTGRRTQAFMVVAEVLRMPGEVLCGQSESSQPVGELVGTVHGVDTPRSRPTCHSYQLLVISMVREWKHEIASLVDVVRARVICPAGEVGDAFFGQSLHHRRIASGGSGEQYTTSHLTTTVWCPYAGPRE